MTWDWVRRSNTYLTSDTWPAVRFQPTLYLFMWAASVRLSLYGGVPPRFDALASSSLFYPVWLGMGIISPMGAALSWWMIVKRSGRTRFMGMWLRLSSDIGMLTVMATFHLADALYKRTNTSETHLYSRYMNAAVLLFLCLLVIRDAWQLVLTERMAGRIHREERR